MERIIKNQGFDVIQSSNPAQLASILRSAINLVYTDYKGAFKFRVIPPDKLKITPSAPIIGEIKKKSSIYAEANDLFSVATVLMNEKFEQAVFPSYIPSEDDLAKLTNLSNSLNIRIISTNPLTIEKDA